MTRALADLSWPHRTARLALRPARREDVEATWRYRGLPEVVQWVTSAPADLEAYRRIYLEPDRLPRTLLIERDGEVVGDLMVRVEDAWSQAEVVERAKGVQAEIGWCLDPRVHGHGYATEAVVELLRICFAELGLHRVVAYCFADNEPSWRLMERVGMRREMATVADSLHRSGRWLDGFGYALLAEEWRGAHGGAHREGELSAY
ncbi:MAG TPA: GNAT family protein [Segeticoccus sp.]|uniref:GNAT family N-acetyltransferase n=1 Tax=Segeticoccus sp. TaxID=2706531 RepID=UPI002D7E718A|nr:GNAT family protein [Segeticoccus sp.]HET8598967.1 GNAT family protein [Segeticoccus sp.]